jgi:hypothetical protein
MSNRQKVTVLYGENKLQKTISLPASATVGAAKKAGSEEILKHLHLQPGVPATISLDHECTDFYPGTVCPTTKLFQIIEAYQLHRTPPGYEI